MKTLFTIACTLLLTYASAQVAPVPPATAPVDLRLAGVHIEKDGKLRTLGTIIAIAGGGLAAATIVMDPEENGTIGMGLGGVAMIASVAFYLSAASHAKKAGKILQGKPL